MASVFQSCHVKTKPDRAQVIDKLKSSAKLATVEYVVTKVISSEKKHWLFKDTHFFAETEANIKAGIDLDKLRENDVQINGTRISILLPAIEMINFSYPAEGFHVVDDYTDQNKRLQWNNFTLNDKDKLFRDAETSIMENIDKLGITKSAETNTRKLLTRILRSLGYTEVYISFRKTGKPENKMKT